MKRRSDEPTAGGKTIYAITTANGIAWDVEIADHNEQFLGSGSVLWQAAEKLWFSRVADDSLVAIEWAMDFFDARAG